MTDHPSSMKDLIEGLRKPMGHSSTWRLVAGEIVNLHDEERAVAASALKAAQRENERLKELHSMVGEYYDRYMQDEAEDLAICIDDRQHVLACAIRDVLNEIHADNEQAPAEKQEG